MPYQVNFMCWLILSEVYNGVESEWNPVPYNYPLTVTLKERYKNSPYCKNEKLKEIGEYNVNKVEGDVENELRFVACIYDKENTDCRGEDFMSELFSPRQGRCNLVLTDDDSERCGLATSLMTFCFTDEEVGSVDLDNDLILTKENLGDWYEWVKNECNHIVFVQCNTLYGTHPVACSAYLTAADNSRHRNMFTWSPNKDIMDALTVDDFKQEFKRNPRKCLDIHGSHWYFCHSKPLCD